MKIQIDKTACSGHGRCYVLHPDLFEADEEGYGRVRDVEVDEETARQVVLDCPERAIELDI